MHRVNIPRISLRARCLGSVNCTRYLSKISIATVSFLLLFAASVADQAPFGLWAKPPEPDKVRDVEIKTDTEITRLRRENTELKKLVEQLQKKVELLEQSTKADK